jgi:ElaA protein
MTRPKSNAAFASELDVATLYAILRLRAEVFVVEQECAYLDLDGRDLEQGTRLVWIEQDGAVVATLRMMNEPDGATRIGRVVVTPPMRGRGLADDLMTEALRLAGDRSVVIDAQTYLVTWYHRLGFEVSGDAYLEDGILHTPMYLVRP